MITYKTYANTFYGNELFAPPQAAKSDKTAEQERITY